MSEPDGPGTGIVKHKGGSRGAVATAVKLRREGVPEHELGFAVFHTFHGSDGSFSDAKSARIDAEVQKRCAEVLESQPLLGETESIQVPMDSILQDVVGVDKKRRVFGQGSRSRSLAYSSIGSSLSGSSQIDAEAISQQVEEQVAERVVEIERRMEEKEKVREDKISLLEATIATMRDAQEEQKRMVDEQKRMVDLLLRAHGTSSDRGSS